MLLHIPEKINIISDDVIGSNDQALCAHHFLQPKKIKINIEFLCDGYVTDACDHTTQSNVGVFFCTRILSHAIQITTLLFCPNRR